MSYRIVIVMMIVSLINPAGLSAQSIIHDTRVVQFKTAKPPKKKVRPKSNRRISKRAIPEKKTMETKQKESDNTVQIASADTIVPSVKNEEAIINTPTFVTLPYNLWTEKYTSKPLNIDFQDTNIRVTNTLIANAMTERLLDVPNAFGYGTSGRIATFGNFDFKGARERYEFPNMLTVQRFSMSINYNTSYLALTGGVNVNRYYAIGVTTQYGIHGTATYSFSPNFSITAFGELYNRNPWFYMAAFPYVNTSRYGGYITYKNEKFGTHLGVERYYDPFVRQWEFRPIVTPFIKVSKKLTIELPVGGLLKEGANRLVHGKRQSRPTIMPNM